MISVIITTYGRDKKIEKAIKSVLNQTFLPLEIIVVDDNGKGTENQKKTEEKIKRLNNPLLKYIVMEKNGGANKARNEGIKYSRGKYIAFLDDDDEFEEKKIEEVEAVIEKKEVDLIYSGATLYCNGKKIKYNYKKAVSNRIKEEILKRNYIGSTSFVVLRKEKIILCGMFNEKLRNCQDWDLWIRIIWSNGEVIGIDKSLVKYNIDFEDKVRISNNVLAREATYNYLIKEIREKYFGSLSLKTQKEIEINFIKRNMLIDYENFDLVKYRKKFIKNWSFRYFKIEDYIRFIASYFNFIIIRGKIKKID